MSYLSRFFIFHCLMTRILALTIFAFFSVGNAQAVTIDFDDLNYDDFIGSEDEWQTPLSDEYESLGVIFSSSAYLSRYSTRSLNSITGPGFSFFFVHELPTYVSMYVSALDQYKVGLRAFGPDGYFEDKLTDGGVRGASWESSTPYRDNQFVSFFMPGGISSIYINSQGAPYIDDLSFRTSVPEPGGMALILLGVFTVYLQRKRLQ